MEILSVSGSAAAATRAAWTLLKMASVSGIFFYDGKPDWTVKALRG
jgi:hypothetical protein